MILLTMLISTKMIFGNPSFALFAGGGNECCVVDVGVGQYAEEGVYSVDSPTVNPPLRLHFV
jgi:hypothetical protein